MPDSPKPTLTRGYVVAFIATVIWSFSAIFVGYLYTRFQLPPLVMTFWRDFIVAATLFVTLALIARPLLRLGRRDLPFFVLYGLNLALFNGLWITAVTLTGAAVATVLAYSSPAFTTLIGWRWGGERLNGLKIGAVVSCIVGLVLVSGAYDVAAWQVNPIGIVTGLASGVGFAVYSLMGKASARRGINPWTATLYSFGFAAAFLLLVQRPDTLLWLSRPLANGADGWREAGLGWGILVVLSIGPVLGGYGLYTASLTLLPASTANLIATLEPAMTAVLAVLLLGERLTWPQILGSGLILVGVLFLRFSERSLNRLA